MQKKTKNIVIREPYGDTLLDHLLYHRGIKDEEKELFLNPEYESGLHDPFLFKDMDKAVDRIEKAILSKEKIVIYSDYDCDGLPGAVALAHFLKDINHTNVEHYIPHRHDEGFGLNNKAIEAISKAGGHLIITIDCGISDLETAKFIKELGIDLIITDHHIPFSEGELEVLPEALAIINPKRKECVYPDKNLCGAGVIFKVIQALLLRNRYGLKEGKEKWLLDMVGLATLSDMVPLIGENRIFAKYGLKVLQKTPRPGISHLLYTLKVNQKNLTEDDVQFMITPRINAASRLGNPRDAFMLLSTTDFKEADKLVRALNELNDERKGSVAAIVKEIKNKLSDRNLDETPLIVLGNPNWRPALLGLVATSLVRDFDKPVFLWGRSNENSLKGSCRSDGRINLLELMRGTEPNFFIQAGGHPMSGGFTISNENIHELEGQLIKSFINLKKETLVESLFIDRKISIDDVNWNNWKMIEKMAPFGEGNPKPLFLFENENVEEVRRFGKTRDHLEVIFKNSEDLSISAVSFFAVENMNVNKGDKINFIATFERSVFKNYPELRLRIVEII